MMGRTGFEPVTPGLKGRCSNQPELTAQMEYIIKSLLCQIGLDKLAKRVYI